MHTSFSLSRMITLFQEFWVRSWKSMFVFSAVLAGILAISLLYFEMEYSYRPSKYNEIQQMVFCLGFVLISLGFCIYWYFANWYKAKKQTSLSLPVSALEHTVMSFIWMTILFSVWYNILFYVVNKPISQWAISYEYQSHLNPKPGVIFGPYYPSERIGFMNTFLVLSMAPILLLQSVLFAALLWFRRFALVKAIGFIFLGIILYGGYQNYFIPEWLTPTSWHFESNSLKTLSNYAFTEYNEIKAPLIWTLWNRYHLLIVWILVWGIIYYRIKEQEV